MATPGLTEIEYAPAGRHTHHTVGCENNSIRINNNLALNQVDSTSGTRHVVLRGLRLTGADLGADILALAER
jgi:hypothetical protein